MRVFVAGATATTRSQARAGQLRGQGATPAIMDGLDRESVLSAVKAARPEVIIHQMTALASLKSYRNFDKAFAGTNELRTMGTDYLLSWPDGFPVWVA